MFGQTIKLTFHLLVVANYTLFMKHQGRVNDELNAKYPGREEFMGQWKYLTHMNVAIQTGLFALSALDDILEVISPDNRKITKMIKDFIFSTIGFPVGVFVSVSFWGLYAIDRDLVFPDELDQFFPPITNHMMHTVPALTLLMELCLYHHQYPPKEAGIGMIALFMAFYYTIIVMAHKYTGVWVYGLFDVISTWQRYLIVALFTLVTIMFYFVGEAITSCQFPSLSSETKKKKKAE